MKSIAAATLFASVALAQSASLIPTGISTDCSTFLSEFNKDTSLASCTSGLINATAAFAPSTNATAASAKASASAISNTLNDVCKSTTTCSETTIRTKLTDFYKACEAELSSSPNQDVIKIYDVLYAITPLRDAVCTKDDTGAYCANKLSTGTSADTVSSILKSDSTTVSNAVSRRADAQSVVSVNAQTFADNNLLFLLLKPDLASDSLCVTCTRNILTSYVSWESSVAYAPGLSHSALLSGQTKLYQAVQDTCGSNFLSGAVAAAAGLAGGIVGGSSNGASSLFANSGLAGAIVGAMAMVMGASL
ncbi:hypothetical protein BD413DRAFT_544449 [Trametes elegans]|nr:hypothetical protein BD413DRAFT_544449 [Trametes elegans]